MDSRLNSSSSTGTICLRSHGTSTLAFPESSRKTAAQPTCFVAVPLACSRTASYAPRARPHRASHLCLLATFFATLLARSNEVSLEQLEDDRSGEYIVLFAVIEHALETAVVVHQLEDVQLLRGKLAQRAGQRHRKHQHRVERRQIVLNAPKLVEQPHPFH